MAASGNKGSMTHTLPALATCLVFFVLPSALASTYCLAGQTAGVSEGGMGESKGSGS